VEGYRDITALFAVDDCNDPGPIPKVIYPRIDQLVVSEKYQRDLSNASRRQIRTIARNWNWDSFKAPNIAETATPGVWEVVDGQHTAIAAAINGNVPVLPCLLGEARTDSEKAKAFLEINTSRVMLTQAAIFRAELAKGDPVAVDVAEAMKATGVVALEQAPGRAFRAGEVLAIGTLKAIAKRSGRERLQRFLEIAVQAGSKPISSTLLKALDVATPQAASEEHWAAVARVVKNQKPGRLEVMARSTAQENGGKTYEVMADLISNFAKLPIRAGRVRLRADPKAGDRCLKSNRPLPQVDVRVAVAA
jgi:hypothetical protein